MRTTELLLLRRILNSPYHPFKVIPKPSNWMLRERLHRFSAWQYGQHRKTVRGGYTQLNKQFIYLDMQRQDRDNYERHYAIERVKIAVAEHNLDYYLFKEMLAKAHILLDDIVLSQLAMYEPSTFKALTELADKIAQEEGTDDPLPYHTAEELAHVCIDDSLRNQQPLAEPEQYPMGPTREHRSKPRKLRLDEFY